MFYGKTVVAIGENAFHCPITSVIIPDSITNMQVGAFKGCTSLRYLKIGNGITEIEPETFCNCNNLNSEHLYPYLLHE